MNKTHIVLQTNNPPPRVANLEIVLYRYLQARSNYTVRTLRRAGETYFQLSEIKPTLFDHLPSLREVTEEFLAITTPEDGVQFLMKYGPVNPRKPRSFSVTATVKWSELLTVQAQIRQLWSTQPKEWKSIRPPEGPNSRLKEEVIYQVMFFHPTGDFSDYPPVLIFHTDNAMSDLTLDLWFTALSGLPSAFCARADCNRLFQKTTKHERKYCSTDCAHIESVRSHRARTTLSK